jgi:hypothetical protein
VGRRQVFQGGWREERPELRRPPPPLVYGDGLARLITLLPEVSPGPWYTGYDGTTNILFRWEHGKKKQGTDIFRCVSPDVVSTKDAEAIALAMSLLPELLARTGAALILSDGIHLPEPHNLTPRGDCTCPSDSPITNRSP